MDGSLIIDKPAGFTSHDVVAKARRILTQQRIGHTGTLDPFATGLLVILVGRATRLAQFLSGLDKEYEAVIRLGYATDTGDVTGKRIETGETARPPLSLEKLEEAFASLRGNIEQVPPMYSAKKHDGQRLYELARRGVEVERRPVQVCIHELEAIGVGREMLKDNRDGTCDLKVRVVCSAGTYVRTLAEDFGKRLQVGAHLAELRRTRVSGFRIDNALTLDQLQTSVAYEAIGTVLLTPDETISHLPCVNLSASEVELVRNGRSITPVNEKFEDGEHVRLRDESDKLIAVGTFESAAGLLHPRVVIG